MGLVAVPDGVPLFVVDAFWPLLQLEWRLIPRGVNLSVLVFLAWNVFFGVRWFAFSSRSVPGTAPQVQNLLVGERFLVLTARARQVAERALQGQSNLEIATELGVSLGTIKNHVYSIFNKTGASSRKELARMAGVGLSPRHRQE